MKVVNTGEGDFFVQLKLGEKKVVGENTSAMVGSVRQKIEFQLVRKRPLRGAPESKGGG